MQLAVRKSNDLIEVGENLSKSAKLFVLFLIAKMPMAETEFRDLTFTYDDLKRIANIDGKKRISTLKEAEKMMDELGMNPLKFENAEFRDTVTWFARKRYFKKKATWQFRFHEELKPYLLQLKSHFTKYSFWYTVCLSPHAIKMYEVMKRYEYLGTCEIPIEKLKYFLGIEDKYREYYEFRRWVLDETQKELKKYTDVAFEYEAARKKGRRIVSLRFFIEKNKPQVVPEQLKKAQRQQQLPFAMENEKEEVASVEFLSDAHKEMINTIKGWGGKEAVIHELINTYGIEKIEYQFRHTKNVMDAGKIKSGNPFGWFRSALKGNYEDPLQEKKKKAAGKAKEQKRKRVDKTNLDKQLKALKQEYYNNKKEIGDTLLKEQPELLSQIIEAARTNIVIGKKVRAGKTPEEIYADRITRGVVLQEMQASFPERFSEVEQIYPAKIKEIEQRFFAVE